MTTAAANDLADRSVTLADPAQPTVLTVDDEASVSSALRRLFRLQGYRTLQATSGAEGLALMREHAVDLVISDMRMPEMDGARFLAQVRAHDAGIVRILLTGYADIGATVAAINQGEIHRYITKPWNDQDLVQVVRDALSRRDLERRNAELAATVGELERFVTYAPVGVVYTSEGVVQRVNGTTAGMFGYTEAQMKGMPGEQLYRSAEDYGDLASRAADVLSRGEPLHHEMWMRHADGHPIWVQLDAPVADRGDTRRGTWWMMQDRTEIRNAQQQLQERFEELRLTISKLEDAQNQLLQQDKMASIGQLAAGVAHEINNPVAFVSSNLNTLRRAVRSRFAPCPVPARPSASGCPSAGRSPCLPALCRRPGWRELRRAGRRQLSWPRCRP